MLTNAVVFFFLLETGCLEQKTSTFASSLAFVSRQALYGLFHADLNFFKSTICEVSHKQMASPFALWGQDARLGSFTVASIWTN